MKICQTRGCEVITGDIFTNSGWMAYCPVCQSQTFIEPPRQPDAADRSATGAYACMRAARYADAEAGFLSAAGSTPDSERKAFYLWLSLLCRYGVSYVEEIRFESIPAKRRGLFLPSFGRFPLPDTDILATKACRELLPLLPLGCGIPGRISELAALLREIADCLPKRSTQSDVFIAWHDSPDEADKSCSSFADKLYTRLLASKECYSFLSFRDLAHVSVDHYEPHIYAALSAAQVMVIVIRDYDALDQKFLRMELKHFLNRKQAEPHLRIYFCGMKGHTGSIPAFLLAGGAEIHREDCENEDIWAEVVSHDVLNILREQRRKTANTAKAVPAQPAALPSDADPLHDDLIWVRFQLSCGYWDNAKEKLAELNKRYPVRGEIYLYMLLAEYRLSEKSGLIHTEQPYENTPYWQFAYRYADAALREKLDKLLADTKALRQRREQEAAAAKAAAERAAAEEAERQRREREAAVAKAAAERAAAEEAERLRREREAAKAIAEAAARTAAKKDEHKSSADDVLYGIVKETIAKNEAARAAAQEAERMRRERDAAYTREAVEKAEQQRKEREAQNEARRKADAEEADRRCREQEKAEEEAERRRSQRLTADQAAQRLNQKHEEENRAALAAIKAKQEADDKLYRIVKEHISGNQSGKAAAAPMQQRLQNLHAASDAAVEKQRSRSPVPAPKPTPFQMETASRLLNAKGITNERLPSGIVLTKGTGFTGKHLEIPEGVTMIGDMAFWKFFNMKTLESVTFPATLTAIGDDAFGYCVSLTEVTIPDGVKVIGKSAFAGCSKLQRITLPAGLKTLPANLFKWCHLLTEVTIPEGVTAIESGAFESCGGLRTVRIPASVTAMGEGTKEKVFVNTRNVTVITPKGSYAEEYCRKHKISCRHS